MKALSIREPYASQIMRGEKRIENRSWGEAVRGTIAVHRCGPDGAIIGTVDVVDVIGAAVALRQFPEQAPFIFGPLCWVLRNPRRLPAPIPCKGRLSLWECSAFLPHETPVVPTPPESAGTSTPPLETPPVA